MRFKFTSYVCAAFVCMLTCALLAIAAALPHARDDKGALFSLGEPDGSALEFGLADVGYQPYAGVFTAPVVYTVGKSKLTDWPFIHPSTHDGWAGGRAHTFTIKFHADASQISKPLFLHIGILADWEPSRISIKVNDKPAGEQRLPISAQRVEMAFNPGMEGIPTTLDFPVPQDAMRLGDNQVGITLDDGSWLIYDYVRLNADPAPPKRSTPPAPELLRDFLSGPLSHTNEIVFAVRKPGNDGHWYANFGYDANDPRIKMYNDGGRLCALNLRTSHVRTLLDDPRGGIRDPQVHYDGAKIVFSYRKAGSLHYHLYEIGSDGGRLRQLTDGPFDDIEPTYVPDGGIVFISSRCNRWVNCWRTPVASLYRADGDGSHIRQLSSNNEHENTPWPLPDGRLLYQRWEYVDRSQVDYHHLWTCRPDGTGQMIYYGNMNPGTVMIDAKPIPGTNKVVAIFSPGHGQREHDGEIVIVDPSAGPDVRSSVKRISRSINYRDPWAFSEEEFMASSGPSLVLMNARGAAQPIFTLSPEDVRAGLECQEPRPIMRRQREAIVPDQVKLSQRTGRMILADVLHGRNMTGIAPGEIKKLLVLETLPKPVNFTGGMEPLSYGGTFTLERILGTVPVEPDGSAYFEVPALRSVFFVALDGNDVPVKRMQSFTTAQPGEVVSCVGCHDQRTQTLSPMRTAAYYEGAKPLLASTSSVLQAVRRAPSKIEAVAGVPDVFDFVRDIQPILNRRCLSCHDWKSHAGGVVLSGDRGPIYSQSYFSLFARGQVSDGRNRAVSNYAPRTLGSCASPLMRKLDGSHHSVAVPEEERKLIRLWIDTGAPYPGTYAALGTGMVGGYVVNALDRRDLQWPETRAASDAIGRRCAGCHSGDRALPLSVSDDQNRQPWVDMSPNDPRRKYANHLLYNLSQPALSRLLLAPLAEASGGFGTCKAANSDPIFASAADPDYRMILAGIARAKQQLEEMKRFDMAGFKPHDGWIREMQGYGILPANLSPDATINPYTVEQQYWRSLWYRP